MSVSKASIPALYKEYKITDVTAPPACVLPLSRQVAKQLLHTQHGIRWIPENSNEIASEIYIERYICKITIYINFWRNLIGAFMDPPNAVASNHFKLLTVLMD